MHLRIAAAKLPLGVAVLLACAVLRPAAADSGVGVDLWIANKLDPSAGAAMQSRDDRGTSWLSPVQQRTPTGFLYLCPADPVVGIGDDWVHWGRLDFGYLGTGGDDRNALWSRFAAWGSGFVLGLLDLHFQRPSDGSYVDVRASRVSDHNQYVKATVGRAGSYRIDAFARENPNVVSANARSIWNGVGTNSLTLAGGLVAAGSTPAEVAAVSAAAPLRILQVNRDKQGLGLNYFFSREWTAYVNVSDEQRKGTRPFGGPFFFNYPFPANGGVLETIKPIDDSTINANLGLRFAGRAWRMDFGYSGSFYRDRYREFDYEMPFALYPVIPGATSAALTRGQFSMEPDNDYHNLRATLTRKFGGGEFSLTASGATMRQNDTLLAPVSCDGVFGIDLDGSGRVGPANPFLYSCANWNTPDALSRKRADMRIDTSLVDARLVMQPSADFSWRAGIKYNREDYRNVYLMYNPLTGDYGYVSENGSQGSVVPGEVGLWNPLTSPSDITRVRSLPLDMATTEAQFGADWRGPGRNTLGATLTFNRFEPTHRERTRADASSIKLTWTRRAFDWLTLRANYTYLKQSGDRYDYDPYEFTYSIGMPGFVAPDGGVPAHTNSAMRKFDLASRDENKVDVMATLMPREDMTLSVSLRGDWNAYDAQIGRTGYDTMGLAVQWEWQPSPRTNASTYYTFDRARVGIANVNETGQGADPSLGGPTYPLDYRWWVSDRQRNHSIGALFSHRFARARFDLDWNWLYSRGTTRYTYAGPGALANVDGAVGAGGGEFPSMGYRVNSLTASVHVPINPRTALRVFDSYERGRVADWHYLGFEDGQVFDHRVYADGGPRSYSANLVGVMLEIVL